MFGFSPDSIIGLVVVGIVLWMMMGHKKNIKKLYREDTQLGLEVSIAKKKAELKELQHKNGVKNKWLE